MQKTLFSLIIALLPFLCMAQTNDSASYVQEYKAIGKINIYDLSNGVEIKLGKTFTTYQQFGFAWTASYSDLLEENKFRIDFFPLYLGEFRYYHNMKGRIRRGKRVEGFFANYFALQYHVPIQLPKIASPAGFTYVPYYLGLHYGLQRKFAKRWYWDVNLGGGFSYYFNRFFFTEWASFGIGYTFH